MADHETSVDKNQASLYVMALKFILAGDLESGELLASLDERIKGIEWTSASFKEDTEHMRNGLSQPTENEKAMLHQVPTEAFVHQIAECSARLSEGAAQMIPKVKLLKRQIEYSSATCLALTAFLSDTLKVFDRARDRLQMLNAETDDLQLPPFPTLGLPPK